MNDILQPVVGLLEGEAVPRWAVMWGVAGLMFAAAKGLTLWEVRRQRRRLAVGRTTAYLLLWVGMDARGFLRPGKLGALEPCRAEAAPGVAKAVGGALLLWGVAPLFQGVAAGWIGMIGMVALLHFGLFHLLAVFWARRGVLVEPIMNRPLCAQTLAEFWGERWNRAFNELMFRFVFRPALRRLAPAWALLLVFLVSGLIHDVAISVPAGGGHGLPTIYFLVQGVGLLVQRVPIARRMGWAGGLKGRLLTGVVLLAPLPLLFHAPFIERVILPFMEVIGAGRIGG
jgi:hypothetical protein